MKDKLAAPPQAAPAQPVVEPVPEHPPIEPLREPLRVDPTPFFVLGLIGLVPFVAGAVALWIVNDAVRIEAQRWLLTYAAVALTFAGAAHWSVAMLERTSSFGLRWGAALWSVVPMVAAWIALNLGARRGLALILVAFVLQLLMDRRLANRAILPRWYLPLRTILIVGAVAALGFSLFFRV